MPVVYLALQLQTTWILKYQLIMSKIKQVWNRPKIDHPLWKADGTWTDIPRCIEHEPGVPEQVPGLCPGIPGKRFFLKFSKFFLESRI